jgi:hypothetical protein
MLRRNIQHWFLCGLLVGAMIGLTVAMAYGAVVLAAGADFRAYPAIVTAVVFGGSCWLFKRDGQGHGLRRVRSEYCFISKERKARIEDLV